jgi:hypothetical protein
MSYACVKYCAAGTPQCRFTSARQVELIDSRFRFPRQCLSDFLSHFSRLSAVAVIWTICAISATASIDLRLGSDKASTAEMSVMNQAASDEEKCDWLYSCAARVCFFVGILFSA